MFAGHSVPAAGFEAWSTGIVDWLCHGLSPAQGLQHGSAHSRRIPKNAVGEFVFTGWHGCSARLLKTRHIILQIFDKHFLFHLGGGGGMCKSACFCCR